MNRRTEGFEHFLDILEGLRVVLNHQDQWGRI
jgi:hypothetical protein